MTDRDPLDDLLRDALSAEADRARPASGAGEELAARARAARRRRSAALVSTAAIVVAALLAGGVAALDGGDADEPVVSVDTTPEPTSASTGSTPATSTTAATDTTSTSTTSTAAGPLDVAPLLEPRPTPPEQLVAQTSDGRVVLLDTQTGAEVRELARVDGPAELAGVDVWGDLVVWADGDGTYRRRLDGTDGPLRIGSGAYPDLAVGTRFVVTFLDTQIRVTDSLGDHGRYWDVGDLGVEPVGAALSPDGRTLVAVVANEVDAPLAVVDVAELPGLEGIDAVPPEPVASRLIPGRWAAPTFDRDGDLVVADLSEEGAPVRRVIDVATGEVIGTTGELDGRPWIQDHDATGEWLVSASLSDGGGGGPIRWVGPDGSTGLVPGEFFAAAW
jgi:hypothetical protein